VDAVHAVVADGHAVIAVLKLMALFHAPDPEKLDLALQIEM
jgi:hypothetical protein